MATHNLTVSARSETGKAAAKRLRHAGLVPAVAYGHKEEPVKLAVDSKELRELIAHHESKGLLMLKYKDGSGGDISVIIKELQRHPVRHTINAVDFLRVSLDEEVTAMVRIALHGEPIGVKQDGGVLVQALHEIEVAAFPQNLPEEIAADVTHLEFEGAPLHVKELTLPQGVRAITDGEETVAVVNAPKVAPTEEPEAVPSEEEAAEQAENVPTTEEA